VGAKSTVLTSPREVPAAIRDPDIQIAPGVPCSPVRWLRRIKRTSPTRGDSPAVIISRSVRNWISMSGKIGMALGAIELVREDDLAHHPFPRCDQAQLGKGLADQGHGLAPVRMLEIPVRSSGHTVSVRYSCWPTRRP
jgi:hypothetical protein